MQDDRFIFLKFIFKSRFKLGLSIFIGLLLIPFNNCSEADNRLFVADGGSGSQLGGLKIGINGSSTIKVSSAAQTFTVSGSCSSGVFSDSEIAWQILNGNNVVYNSTMAGGTQFLTYCRDGVYSIEARVPCPGITVSGSNCFGLIRSWNFRTVIYGLDAAGNYENGAMVTSGKIVISP
jgi:hypothetical protein